MTDAAAGNQVDDPAQARVRWLLIALLFAGTALNYVDRQVLSLLKPTLEAEFGWSDQDFAHMGSVFQLSAAVSLLAVGWFVDRFGVRFAYGLAVSVWSLAGIAHAAAATVSQFVVARSVLAVAESVNTPAAVKAAATYLPLRQRSLGLGLVNTAPNIGAILTPLLIPPLALAFGWQAAFVLTGGLGFVWLALWWWGTRGLTPAAPAKAAVANVSWRELFKDRRTWTIVGAKALTDCVWWFVLFWSTDFLVKSYGLTQGEVGRPNAIIFTLAALGAFSCGFLFTALLKRGLSLNAARKSSMLFYALMVLPIPLALQAPSATAAALLIGLALFAHQGFSTSIFGLAADTVPVARLGSVMAMGGIAGNLTGTGIIELTGWCLGNGIGYWPMFAIAACAYLTALAFIQIMQPQIRAAD
jgi:ACS family hexuronate transporter-like MFS transporter